MLTLNSQFSSLYISVTEPPCKSKSPRFFFFLLEITLANRLVEVQKCILIIEIHALSFTRRWKDLEAGRSRAQDPVRLSGKRHWLQACQHEFNPRFYMVEGENRLPSSCLQLPHVHGGTQARTHTHTRMHPHMYTHASVTFINGNEGKKKEFRTSLDLGLIVIHHHRI